MIVSSQLSIELTEAEFDVHVEKTKKPVVRAVDRTMRRMLDKEIVAKMERGEIDRERARKET